MMTRLAEWRGRGWADDAMLLLLVRQSLNGNLPVIRSSIAITHPPIQLHLIAITHHRSHAHSYAPSLLIHALIASRSSGVAMSDRHPLLIYSLYIINKAGGLIYQKVSGERERQSKRMKRRALRRCTVIRRPICVTARQPSPLSAIHPAMPIASPQDFSTVPKLSTNDYLRLASTFHSLHAITARGIDVSPINDPKRAAAAGPDALPRNQEGIQSLEAKVKGTHKGNS